MLAEQINRVPGFEAIVVPHKQFLKQTEDWKEASVKRSVICVCMKYCDMEIINRCKVGLKRTMVWDMIDTELRFYHLVPHFDLVLANSHHHAQILQSRYNATNTQVVYHHHSNDFGLDRNLSVENWIPRNGSFCYVGAFRLNSSAVQSFSAIAERVSMRFVDINTAKLPSGSQYEHLLPLATQCDVALIWPTTFDEFTLEYRPVTRLVTWWSMGIPTIYYPYAPYMEIGDVATRQLAASTYLEVYQKLAAICNSTNRINILRIVGLQKRKSTHFQLSVLLHSYLSALSSVSERINISDYSLLL